MKWIFVAVILFGVSGAIAQGQDALAYRSKQHPTLNQLAQQHADNMARTQYQSHNGFSEHRAPAMFQAGFRSPAEICAETWERQRNATWKEQWIEYTVCWRQSSGHWSVARIKHKWIGVGSARGRNGVWYGCLISAD